MQYGGTMDIRYSAICDIGLRAKENQDRVVCLTDGQTGLFAVADGMGGLSDGSFASRTIKEELESWWHHYTEETCLTDEIRTGADGLKAALRKANEKILNGTAEGKRCGSTAVALLLENGTFTVISCGDSRCYKAEKGFLFTRSACITKDDIWENTESNIRGLTAEEIRAHKNRGKLVRAVGTGKELSFDEFTGKPAGRSVFLLCSDGMHKRVPEEEVGNAMKGAFSGKEEDLKRICEDLKTQVYRKGAADNISIIIVSCRENGNG